MSSEKVWTNMHAVNRVRLYSQAKGIRRAVLVEIAFHINAEGLAYPSLDTLVADTGMKRDTVVGHLKALEGMGELEIIRKAGQSNRYRLLLPDTGVPNTGLQADKECLNAESSPENGTPEMVGTGAKPKLSSPENGTQIREEIMESMQTDREVKTSSIYSPLNTVQNTAPELGTDDDGLSDLQRVRKAIGPEKRHAPVIDAIPMAVDLSAINDEDYDPAELRRSLAGKNVSDEGKAPHLHGPATDLMEAGQCLGESTLTIQT